MGVIYYNNIRYKRVGVVGAILVPGAPIASISYQHPDVEVSSPTDATVQWLLIDAMAYDSTIAPNTVSLSKSFAGANTI